MADSLYIADKSEPQELVSPLSYGGSISDSKLSLDYYLHDFIAEQSDYYVFLGLLQLMFNDIKSVADNIETLSDVNNIVDVFLPKLSYLMDYTFRYDLSDDVNRDIIKRLLYIYKHKGRDKEVLEAADFANNDNWIANTLFVPTPSLSVPVPDDRTSTLYYPVDFLFTWNVSRYDENHRYPDSVRWRDGVIVVEAENINKKVRDAIKRVLPAGLKCYYDSKTEMHSDGKNGEEVGYGKSLKFKEWILNLRYTLDYFLRVEPFVNSDRWSENYLNYGFIWSGNQVLFPYYDLEKTLVSSMLPLYGEYPNETVKDIFQFLKVLELALPNYLSYLVDELAKWSIGIINKSHEISGKDDVIWTIDKDKLIVEEPIYINTYGYTAWSGSFVMNLEDNLEGTSDIPNSSDNEVTDDTDENILNKFTERVLTLKNPTLTELTTIYRGVLFDQWDNFFSLYTENPIHDISSYEIQSFVVSKQYEGFPTYDKGFGWSAKYSLSGLPNVTYMQAKFEHIYAWDDHYRVSEVLDKIPAIDNYRTGTLDSICKPDERLPIDVHVYEQMEYRGPIDVEFYDQAAAVFADSFLDDEIPLYDGIGYKDSVTYNNLTLDDRLTDFNTVADSFLRFNRIEQIYDRKLDDFCIIETSTAVRFGDLKLNYVFQLAKERITPIYSMPLVFIPVHDLMLNIPYGNVRFVVYDGIDRYKYLDEHTDDTYKTDVVYETDFGSRQFNSIYLTERLISDYSSSLNSIPYLILDLTLDSFEDITLDSYADAFNFVYEKLSGDLTLESIISPSLNHFKIIGTEYLFDRAGRFILGDLFLSDFVKILESVS